MQPSFTRIEENLDVSRFVFMIIADIAMEPRPIKANYYCYRYVDPADNSFSSLYFYLLSLLTRCKCLLGHRHQILFPLIDTINLSNGFSC